MTLVLLQYPVVHILFILSALAVLSAAKWPRWGFPAALIFSISTILSALICAVPMAEILLLLLLLVLECCILCPKEDET